MEKLSISLEDYIEEIYRQVLKSGNAKVTMIAEALGVKKASVTGALNTLMERKLINYAPYTPVTLTCDGEKIAKKILQKHENLAEFFIEVLKTPQAEAIEIACKMEHLVSEDLFEKIVKLKDYIKTNLKDEINEIYK